MKQGTNFIMDVNVQYDLKQVDHIDFLFVQDNARKLFHYPSDAVKKDKQSELLHIFWSYEDTYLFNPKKHVQMDTRIILKDSVCNPETSIVKFCLSPTLFDKYEIEHDAVQE